MPGDQSAQQYSAASTAWPLPGGRRSAPTTWAGLLRPPELLRARDDFAAGFGFSAGQLRQAEDAAIREVVRRQQEAGLRAATDGELRRESWHMDFIYQLGGIKKVQDDTIRWRSTTSGKTTNGRHRPRTSSPRSRSSTRSSVRRSRSCAIPSPPRAAQAQQHPLAEHGPLPGGRSAIDESVYPDLDQFWLDLAAAYADEVRRCMDRLPLPAVRRHQSGVHERPGSSAQHVAGRSAGTPAAPARALHREHQLGAGLRLTSRPGGHHPHVPGQQPEHVGGRGRLRVRGRRPCSTSSPWTGSTVSGTTSARAVSSRCGS